MKNNIKNQLLILLLLLAFIATILVAVTLLVIDIFWLVKIFVLLASILLSFYIFVQIKKTNKKLVYIEKPVEDKNETLVEENKPEQKIRCPKCYNFYDGEFCFVCGYKKENKA